MTPPRLLASGDAALLAVLGEEINPAVNRRVHALAARLRDAALPGLGEAVPAYATLLIHYDPAQLDEAQARACLKPLLDDLEQPEAVAPRRFTIPVRYGGADGPDLEFVAQRAGLTPEDVVRLHTGRDYRVYMMGFTPGFAYLGELDERLAVPRLETPRVRVPAGSVGLAGRQTGLYPLDSPGGWRLIGRTDLVLFDLERDPPFRLAPGDSVRFAPAR